MKQARIADYWKATYRNEPGTELVSVTFNSVPTLGSFSIDLGRGISAITGLNGAGKSTVLHSIWLCLCDEASLSAMALDSRLTEGSVELLLKVGHASVKFVYDFSETARSVECDDPGINPYEVQAFLVDVAEVAPALQRYFRKDPNYQDLLDQQGSASLNETELDVAKFVAGRDYDSIKVFELEIDIGLDNNWEVLPYFHVTQDGVQYGIEHLGLGELSGLLIYWAAKRMPSGSILLIDEPECFLASHSQAAISDIVAYFSAERGVSCVMTSHSDTVVEKIPPKRRIVTIMNSQGVACTTAENVPNHLTKIGVGKGTKLVAVTEDHAATIFLKEMITIGAPALRGSVEICWAGSSGEVVTALNGLVEGFDNLSLKFVGVLDGDQKSEKHRCKWPLRYLPTDEDPEQVAKLSAYNNVGLLSQSFGVNEAEIHAALAAANGADYHDWPFIVARQLGRRHTDVLEVCLRGYVANDMPSDELHQFIKCLTSREVLPA
ncbi:hypothetical protein FIU83_08125 [Halomonas sp. THAF5a]|uniref:ATP-dependent nuclease n=1 Tax=Halomonas sp. THAF5a TaxID=2587844 RepID=UPI001268BEEA|nr:ATP-binding protein [Halomonas sp. THAF5a]QFU01604.1 hypothetical protein FIU83_08125 [Halomonas sp. THAF5a]